MNTSTRTALIAIAAIKITSCTVTTAPDGTVTRQADANAWLRIVELIARDEVPPVAIPVEEAK